MECWCCQSPQKRQQSVVDCLLNKRTHCLGRGMHGVSGVRVATQKNPSPTQYPQRAARRGPPEFAETVPLIFLPTHMTFEPYPARHGFRRRFDTWWNSHQNQALANRLNSGGPEEVFYHHDCMLVEWGHHTWERSGLTTRRSLAVSILSIEYVYQSVVYIISLYVCHLYIRYLYVHYLYK